MKKLVVFFLLLFCIGLSAAVITSTASYAAPTEGAHADSDRAKSLVVQEFYVPEESNASETMEANGIDYFSLEVCDLSKVPSRSEIERYASPIVRDQEDSSATSSLIPDDLSDRCEAICGTCGRRHYLRHDLNHIPEGFGPYVECGLCGKSIETKPPKTEE